jgi:hypothetical protein
MAAPWLRRACMPSYCISTAGGAHGLAWFEGEALAGYPWRPCLTSCSCSAHVGAGNGAQQNQDVTAPPMLTLWLQHSGELLPRCCHRCIQHILPLAQVDQSGRDGSRRQLIPNICRKSHTGWLLELGKQEIGGAQQRPGAPSASSTANLLDTTPRPRRVHQPDTVNVNSRLTWSSGIACCSGPGRGAAGGGVPDAKAAAATGALKRQRCLGRAAPCWATQRGCVAGKGRGCAGAGWLRRTRSALCVRRPLEAGILLMMAPGTYACAHEWRQPQACQ